MPALSPFSMLSCITRLPAMWRDNVCIAFDDGDITEVLDINTLKSSRVTPEYEQVAGVLHQRAIVGVGLNRDTGWLSVELGDHREGIFSAEELSDPFVWYLSIDTYNDEVQVHYTQDPLPVGMTSTTWSQWQHWFKTHQPAVHLHECRPWKSVA